MTARIRIERDLLGEREVPADAYTGVHTLRARENFRLSRLVMAPELVKAIAMVKKACCEANRELGFLDAKKADAIAGACREIIGGALAVEFTLDALQGGAGTSANMNVNEVVANRALELLGKNKGDYAEIHPIEHVNLHQSTNDVYPTALKIASIFALRDLSEKTALLQGELQKKEKEFGGIICLGRTELQDAVPMTLGAQFSSFADAIGRDRWRTSKCEERLRVVNIGGTAVGTGLAAPKSYIFLVIEKLRDSTGLGLARGDNVVDQTANADAFAEVAGIVAAHAANLQKTSADFRLMHDRGDISLPAVQAGSSIMPGKVNPVICEAAISAAIKARSECGVVTETAAMGTLQINEFLPLLGHSLLTAVAILAAADAMLANHVTGITANQDACRRHVDNSTSIITAFLPKIGYEAAQKLVREYSVRGTVTFRIFLEEKLGNETVAATLSPQNLMALGYKDVP
jgi:aspartate ammonia-lyase